MSFLNLEDVKLYLRVDHGSEDALIEALVASAIELVETRIRRPIVSGDVTLNPVANSEDEVPAAIKLAIKIIVAFLYENRSATDEEIRNRVLRQALLDQYIDWGCSNDLADYW